MVKNGPIRYNNSKKKKKKTASRASDVSPRLQTSETSHGGHDDDSQAVSRPPLPQIIYVCALPNTWPLYAPDSNIVSVSVVPYRAP